MNNLPDLKNQISQMGSKLVRIKLTPDEIDEFIDWICVRWDLDSFYRSSIQFKSNELRKFLNEREKNHDDQIDKPQIS